MPVQSMIPLVKHDTMHEVGGTDEVAGLITSTTQTIAGAKTFSGVTSVTNSTASTSKTTGALLVTGGAGISGDIWANKVMGAAWNDYAEFRQTDESVIAGMVVVDRYNKVVISTKRLMKMSMIVSDTYGFAIGQMHKTDIPIAVSGRVLAYTDKSRNKFKTGDVVCSGKHGTVSKMSCIEKILFPFRAIGRVSEVPNYEYWGENNIKVNNRIWIRVY